MGVFENYKEVNGEIRDVGWIEWVHFPMGAIHCPICLKLNGCWFNNSLKPILPQHEKCHCFVNQIVKPISNVTAWARCDLRKFTDYIFSDKYAWNGKRDLFEILGFKKEDSQFLKLQYEQQAVDKYCEGNYNLAKLDIEGQRINIDINFEVGDRKIVFTSGWMVRPKGEITNNTPLAD